MNPVRNKISNGMKLLLLALCVVVGVAIYVSSPEQPACPVATAEQCGTGVRVLFVGDIMLDRNVARTIMSEGPAALFAGTSALLADADLRVGNLEGTITGSSSIAQKDNSILRFTFDPAQTDAVLAPLHMSSLSLANNHSLDFGQNGYAETRRRLKESGIAAFGHPYNAPGKISTTLLIKDKTICLVGFHSLYDASAADAIAEIQRLRSSCWRVVAFAHWGDEYQERSNAAQQDAAHAFVDAGADLVVGAHPHVVQEHEIYKGKAIFYSLGNFMFYQNFSWGTTHGLAVRADFYEAQTRFTLTPTNIVEQRSSVGTSTVAQFNLP